MSKPFSADLDARGIGRRAVLAGGAGGLLAALLSRLTRPGEAWAAGPPAKAKACIVLWMNGGPSHIDTFDPKPGSPGAGPFKAIKTKAKDVLFCEHAPLLAEQAHRIAVVRSVTSKEGNHERARYLMHTGYSPNPTALHPSLGGWVSEEIGDKNADLPSFISVNGPSAGAGLLGVQHGPFVVAKAGQPPQNIERLPGVGPARFNRRRAALGAIEARFAEETGDAKVRGRMAVYDQAVRLMQSPKLRAFDLSEEPEAALKAYGDSDFGRGCLLARRLVEGGAKLVEVTLDGWDTHKDNFERVKKQMAQLDPAMSALLRDLDERKLLDKTLVVWMGDFGRTPRINGDEGRDHHPQAWSALLAGGGVRGGIAHGSTGSDGDKVIEKAVTVPNLFATIAATLGMDPAKESQTATGRPIAITDEGSVVRELLAAR